MVKIENKLKHLREIKKLKQKDVADAAGITTSYYGMIEVGTRKPSIIVAYKLSKYFETDIEEIFFAKANNA